MHTCPDCGERVYNLGCVNCNEQAYIDEQAIFDALAEADDRSASEEHDCGEDTCVCLEEDK